MPRDRPPLVDWTRAEAYLDRTEGRPPEEVFSPRRGGAVDEVRVYRQTDPPHWHLVTLGLSEMGFELTVRLAPGGAAAGGPAPGATAAGGTANGPAAGQPDPGDPVPTWAVDLLVNLAAHSWRTGHEFADGHHIDLGGPIKLDAETAITAAAVTTDATLGAFDGARFLQVVGLTDDELELCRVWRTAAVLDLLRGPDPLLITRLDRVSVLADPAVRLVAEAGAAAGASWATELRVASLVWVRRGRRRSRLVVTMGAGASRGLGPALRRTLAKAGDRFAVIGDAGELRFEVAGEPGWVLTGEVLVVRVTPDKVDELAGLFTGATGSGSPAWLAGLRFVVVP